MTDARTIAEIRKDRLVDRISRSVGYYPIYTVVEIESRGMFPVFVTGSRYIAEEVRDEYLDATIYNERIYGLENFRERVAEIRGEIEAADRSRSVRLRPSRNSGRRARSKPKAKSRKKKS